MRRVLGLSLLAMGLLSAQAQGSGFFSPWKIEAGGNIYFRAGNQGHGMVRPGRAVSWKYDNQLPFRRPVEAEGQVLLDDERVVVPMRQDVTVRHGLGCPRRVTFPAVVSQITRHDPSIAVTRPSPHP